MDQVQKRVSAEKEHHRKTLLETLKAAYDKHSTPWLYLEERAQTIVSSFLGESQLFSCGFSKIVNQQRPPEQETDRIVVLAVMGPSAMTQLERYWHLFRSIFVVNLTISAEETKELIKVSPLKKKLAGFNEISLNFLPFIDGVYSANIIKQNQHINTDLFEESFTSFLVSLSKFHEFRLSVPESSTASASGAAIKTKLEKKLAVLEAHKAKQYTANSPRIKVLLLQRKIDQMSPLLYSYHFGPVSKQIGAFDQKNSQFTTNSAIYTAMFPLDVEEANDFLTDVAEEKAKNQKVKFQLNNFQQAKKVITTHYDEHTSPEQIALQIDTLGSVKQFCKRRAFTTTLQQTIVNGLDESAQKMGAGKTVDRIVQWANIPMEEFKPSQEDYIKILVLSYMVNSFWFWHRRIINASLDEAHKEKIVTFCKKVQGKFAPLQEKPQSEDRLDLFRHQPGIVQATRRWLTKDERQVLSKFDINESQVNKPSKIIIGINGPLGYGELALLLRQVKEIDNKSECMVFCESLVTTKQYLRFILKE